MEHAAQILVGKMFILFALRLAFAVFVLMLLRTIAHGKRCGRDRGSRQDVEVPQARHHQGRRKEPRARGKTNTDSKRPLFSNRLTARYIPNACDFAKEWKAKLWWQPEDFSEFLRVRVLIGRAYQAVAKRRGVKVDEDFPAEPVLAHESRLGLHLGCESPRVRDRKEYVNAVLQEQARQLYKVYDEETGTARGPAMLDSERIAKVARSVSEKTSDYAVREAQRQHEKVLKDLAEPNKEEEEQPLSFLQKANILLRTRARSEDRNKVNEATGHRRNSTEFASAPAEEMCKDKVAGTVPAAASALAASADTRATCGAGAGRASGGLRPAMSTTPPLTLPLTRTMEGQISEVSNHGITRVRQMSQRIEWQISLQSEKLTLTAPSCSSSGRPKQSRGALRGLDLRGFGIPRMDLERHGMTPSGQFACHSPIHPFLADETEEEAEGGAAPGQGAEQDEEDSLPEEDSLSSYRTAQGGHA